MPGVQAGRFDAPDETRSPAETKIDVVKMGDTTAGRRLRYRTGPRRMGLGNEPFVAYEFESSSAEEYAKRTE
jgi:hypothetical protein